MCPNVVFSFVTETPPPPYSRFAMDDCKPKGQYSDYNYCLLFNLLEQINQFFITILHVLLYYFHQRY